MTAAPPHEYIPAGPLFTEPPGGFQPAKVHFAAFAAVLDGVETGDYDNEVIAWLANLDDTTCRVVTSLMWRCRRRPRSWRRSDRPQPPWLFQPLRVIERA